MKASERIAVQSGTSYQGAASSDFISLPSVPVPTPVLLRFLAGGGISPTGSSSRVKPCHAVQPGGSRGRGQGERDRNRAAPTAKRRRSSYPCPEEVRPHGSTPRPLAKYQRLVGLRTQLVSQIWSVESIS